MRWSDEGGHQSGRLKDAPPPSSPPAAGRWPNLGRRAPPGRGAHPPVQPTPGANPGASPPRGGPSGTPPANPGALEQPSAHGTAEGFEVRVDPNASAEGHGRAPGGKGGGKGDKGGKGQAEPLEIFEDIRDDPSKYFHPHNLTLTLALVGSTAGCGGRTVRRTPPRRGEGGPGARRSRLRRRRTAVCGRRGARRGRGQEIMKAPESADEILARYSSTGRGLTSSSTRSRATRSRESATRTCSRRADDSPARGINPSGPEAGGGATSNRASSLWAAAIVRSSRPWAATTCTPTGRPSSSSPSGLVTGSSSTLKTSVVTPRRGAAWGVGGVARPWESSGRGGRRRRGGVRYSLARGRHPQNALQGSLPHRASVEGREDQRGDRVSSAAEGTRASSRSTRGALAG